MSFIIDYAKDTAAGYLKTGIQAGGNLAGNAVGGVGSIIESGGRQFGEGTVGGGIKGFGGYINSYGDGVKQAMAADGSAPKTAVKPGAAGNPAAAKRVPAGVTPKALPSTAGATKPLPAASPRVAGVPKAKTGAVAVPAGRAVGGALPDGKTRINPASRPQPAGVAGVKTATPAARSAAVPAAKPAAGAVARPAAGAPSVKRADGKVSISAASRPTAARPAAPVVKR